MYTAPHGLASDAIVSGRFPGLGCIPRLSFWSAGCFDN